MALDTGKLIRRSHMTVVPMTAEVVARVEKLGCNEPTLLTFQNRRGKEIGEQTVKVNQDYKINDRSTKEVDSTGNHGMIEDNAKDDCD